MISLSQLQILLLHRADDDQGDEDSEDDEDDDDGIYSVCVLVLILARGRELCLLLPPLELHPTLVLPP